MLSLPSGAILWLRFRMDRLSASDRQFSLLWLSKSLDWLLSPLLSKGDPTDPLVDTPESFKLVLPVLFEILCEPDKVGALPPWRLNCFLLTGSITLTHLGLVELSSAISPVFIPELFSLILERGELWYGPCRSFGSVELWYLWANLSFSPLSKWSWERDGFGLVVGGPRLRCLWSQRESKRNFWIKEK